MQILQIPQIGLPFRLRILEVFLVEDEKDSDNISVCYLNAQSVKNKTESLSECISDNDFDILALSETWLGTNIDQVVIGEMLPVGYDIISVPRQGPKSGYGGVAIIHKNSITIKHRDSSRTSKYTTFEHLECAVELKDRNLLFVVVYRPPPSKKNGFTLGTFFDEWQSFMDRYTETATELLLTGDVNFHLDKCDNRDASHFKSILEAHGLQQRVDQVIKPHTRKDISLTYS